MNLNLQWTILAMVLAVRRDLDVGHGVPAYLLDVAE
jgi:hypothetical protein